MLLALEKKAYMYIFACMHRISLEAANAGCLWGRNAAPFGSYDISRDT